MPLLMCPNCNASMQEINRADVAFDMCPTCRGVWLDRGELEKILSAARDELAAQAPWGAPAQAQQQPPQTAPRQRPQQGHGEQGEYGERGEYGRDGRRRRRSGFELFDIFD